MKVEAAKINDSIFYKRILKTFDSKFGGKVKLSSYDILIIYNSPSSTGNFFIGSIILHKEFLVIWFYILPQIYHQTFGIMSQPFHGKILDPQQAVSRPVSTKQLLLSLLYRLFKKLQNLSNS